MLCRSGVFSQRNTRGVIGISLFMQRPIMDIPPIVQFEVERYSIAFKAEYKITQNQHERESYFIETYRKVTTRQIIKSNFLILSKIIIWT